MCVKLGGCTTGKNLRDKSIVRPTNSLDPNDILDPMPW
jgi:hypothetical protein